jgi:hypothetical protein
VVFGFAEDNLAATNGKLSQNIKVVNTNTATIVSKRQRRQSALIRLLTTPWRLAVLTTGRVENYGKHDHGCDQCGK